MRWRPWLQYCLPAERCPACAGASRRGFCAGCARELLRVPDPCTVCGLPRPVGACPRTPGAWHLDAIVAPLRYAPPAADHLLSLKYRGTRRLGRALGLLLADELAAGAAWCEVDALVATPLHRRRLLERGYNQAFEIARAAAACLGLPMIGASLRRRIVTTPQTGLRGAERRDNLHGVFHCRTRLDGMRVAVVDDVITTAATVNAAAEALRLAGARSVVAWAVARTLPGDPDQPDPPANT